MAYSSSLMRFAQEDPTGADYVDGINLYQALDSDPVVRLDPTGEWSWGDTLYVAMPILNPGVSLYQGFRDVWRLARPVPVPVPETIATPCGGFIISTAADASVSRQVSGREGGQAVQQYGHRVKFDPKFKGHECTCASKDIVLVQAIDSAADPAHFDLSNPGLPGVVGRKRPGYGEGQGRTDHRIDYEDFPGLNRTAISFGVEIVAYEEQSNGTRKALGAVRFTFTSDDGSVKLEDGTLLGAGDSKEVPASGKIGTIFTSAATLWGAGHPNAK